MESELRTVGTVKELNGSSATVVFKRTNACGDCHACVSFGSDMAETELKNTLGAKAGDRVSIELHSGSVFKAGLILYGIPLVALMIGAFLGSLIGNLFTAVFGIGAAVLAFLVIHFLDPKLNKNGQFDPRMIAIVGHGEDGSDNNE